MVNILKGRKVVISNAVAESRYKLSLPEQRIIFSAIAQIGRDDVVTNEVMYRVNARDIADIAGVSTTSIFSELKQAAITLFDQRITIKTGVNRKGKPIIKLRRWVYEIDYMEAEGWIALKFSDQVIPYLCQLKSEFTTLSLDELLKFSSNYSIRIYQLMMQWKHIGSLRTSLDWLKNALYIDGKYESIKDFKKNVIDPAIKEINKVTAMNLSYTQEKTGRKITHFTFNFERKAKEAKRMDKKPEAVEKTNKNVTYKNTGESEHMGKYHPFSKAEIMLANKDYPALTEMQVRDKLLAERKAAS